ncbi:MAG: bis-aminopropyl spermidine synthase family protein [bacterium]
MARITRNEEKVLAEMLNSSDPWRVAGHAKVDFAHYVKTLKTLVKKGFISIEGAEILLTEKGMKLVRDINLLPAEEISGRVETARKDFIKVIRRRPRTAAIYDQGYMTLNSVFRRVSLIARMGDASGKRIAVLGDDDLMSVALCLTVQPRHVNVLEVDERLVNLIGEVAGESGLPITVDRWDLRDPLPAKYKGQFDTFVTDPSETMPGLKMFLGRALFTLRAGEGGAGYFGLTAIEASYKKWGAFQQWLLKTYPLAITHILPGYAYYDNWTGLAKQTKGYGLDPFKSMPQATWFNSALVRLETLTGFAPKQTGKTRGTIFEDDESCGTTKEV